MTMMKIKMKTKIKQILKILLKVKTLTSYKNMLYQTWSQIIRLFQEKK